MPTFRHAVNGLGSIPLHNFDGSQPGVDTMDKKCFGSGTRISLNRGVEKRDDDYFLRRCVNQDCNVKDIKLDIIVRPSHKN